MLMDIFYQTLPTTITHKRRVHFHAFMIDVHKRLHAAKIAMGHRGGDPIVPVARDLARDASVLCFDEFQVCEPEHLMSLLLIDDLIGDRHCRCNDSEKASGIVAQLWRCLRHNIKVMPLSRTNLAVLTCIYM